VAGTEVLGLGTDLVDVDRFRLALARQGDRLVARLFSDAERDYAFRHRNPAPRLAARFGAKEAVMKALGVGLWKFALRDVEVIRLPSGQPTIALYNKAAALAQARKVTAWHLTLTHTDTMAAATAVALGDGA
jgi:holo-[acyl-carrier protein] synthase